MVDSSWTSAAVIWASLQGSRVYATSSPVWWASAAVILLIQHRVPRWWFRPLAWSTTAGFLNVYNVSKAKLWQSNTLPVVWCHSSSKRKCRSKLYNSRVFANSNRKESRDIPLCLKKVGNKFTSCFTFPDNNELVEAHQHNIPQILECVKKINYCDLHLKKCIKSMFHWFYMQSILLY